MPDIIISAKFSIGDKAILATETSSRMMYYIVKVVAIKSIIPDVDVNGTDVITYTVEVYSPTSVNKVRMDVIESELKQQVEFTDAFAAF
jgi:hypothetical protein